MTTNEEDDVTTTPHDVNDARTAPARLTASSAADAGARGDAAPGKVVFEATDLSVFYGDFRAVREVTLDIRQHEIAAFIGPSGCGKSTVLRCFNRMNDVITGARVEGDLRYHGVDVYGPKVEPVEVRRRIGMVFQKPNPFPSMSIKENVLAGLRLTRRLGKKDQGQIAETALRGAALWDEVKDRLDRPGGDLSGGQQQRLCIARSLAVEPDVLLMDEPCSALDPIATARIEDLLHDLKARYTIVIVTHNMQQAARVSDKTAFLLSGELVEFGATDGIFTSPRDRRTEDYITGKFG